MTSVWGAEAENFCFSFTKMSPCLQDAGDVGTHGLGQAVGAGAGPGLSGWLGAGAQVRAVHEYHAGAGAGD